MGKSYFYNVWENLVKSRAHVGAVLDCFEKNPRLGFLAPPPPDFAHYFGGYGEGWGGVFEAVERAAKELALSCPISALKPPFRITDNFWIRGRILKKLKGLKEEDASFLPYLWTYLAQDGGFYSGIVESGEYAAVCEVNLRFYLQETAARIRRQCGDFDTFSEMKEKLEMRALEGFLKKYPRILVYGAGEMAAKYKSFLPDIEAYIVSDGQEKPEELEGIPVKYLSEIMVSEGLGIVLCLNETNRLQVVPLLERRGMEHYFCVQ